MVSLESVASLRQRGNELYKASAFLEAAQAYGAAADAARPLFATLGSGAAARELCLALSNRAACGLSLGDALSVLDDTWEVLTLLLSPGTREWQRQLRTGAGWEDWAMATYDKAQLRRAAAYQVAAGCGAAALPALAWLSARRAADAVTRGAALRAAQPPAHGSAAEQGAWQLLHTRRQESPPLPRRNAACAALGGRVYLFGGDAANDGALQAVCADLWSLALPTGDADKPSAVRWTKLAAPKASGGPCASLHAAALASDATGELIVVDSRLDAFAYSPNTAAWRRIGSLVPPGAAPGASYVDRGAPPMLALSPDTLFALSCGADGWTLVSLPLSSGPATCASLPCGGACAPARRRCAHLWWQGSDLPVLRMYGGVENAPNGVPGHSVYAVDGGELAEMWLLQLHSGTWARAPRDGGGVVPAPRARSSLVPLGNGEALLFGGMSSCLPAAPPVAYGSPPWPRFLADAHVFSPQRGWRPVCVPPEMAIAADLHVLTCAQYPFCLRRWAMGAPTPEPAAAALLAFDAASRRVFVGGGFNKHPPQDASDGVMPLHAALFELRCAAFGAVAASASARDQQAAAWQALRCGAQVPVDSARSAIGVQERERLRSIRQVTGAAIPTRAPSAHGFDAMLAAAAALRRPPPETPGATVQWTLSWSCMWTNPAAPHSELYELVISGHDWVTNARRGTMETPTRYSACVGPAEPAAPDLAWALLEAMMQPSSRGGSVCRPDQVRFTARTAHLLNDLLPLLRALDMKLLVEPQAEAAVSCLRSHVSPFGENQFNDDAPHRCQSCRALKTKMKLCGNCRRIRYCDPLCAAAGWEAHRQACVVLALKAQKGQPEPLKSTSCSFGYIAAEAGDTSQEDGSYRGVWL